MDIARPIRNDDDHARAIERIDELQGAEPGSDEADMLEVLCVLVDDYETHRWPIVSPSPPATTETEKKSGRPIEEKRRELQERLKQQRETRGVHEPDPPPRYDEVYFRGMEWLDSL